VFEFHGWAVIRSRINLDDPRRTEDERRIFNELQRELRLYDRPEHFWLYETVNELLSITCTGLRNHHKDWVVDFFRFLATRAPGSYGLLFVQDEEDHRDGYADAFRVFRLARGELRELDDPFLSPRVPIIEPGYDPSRVGTEPPL